MAIKCELYNDSMQGWKCYPIQKAQLIIADIPYNVGTNFYGSNPMWYNGGDNKNGESKLAGKSAFASDFNFNVYEYFHFCSRLMRKEDKKPQGRGRSSNSPCMIVFCSFEQQHDLILAEEVKNVPSAQPEVAKDTNVPNNDCISRQAAIEEVINLWADKPFGNPTLVEIKDCIEALPFAQPERKKGEWIFHETENDRYDDMICPFCKMTYTVDAYRIDDIGLTAEDFDYCPNCGADMRGDSDV